MPIRAWCPVVKAVCTDGRIRGISPGDEDIECWAWTDHEEWSCVIWSALKGLCEISLTNLPSTLAGIANGPCAKTPRPKQKNLLTVAEAAELLQVCEDTVRRLATVGKIPAIKTSGNSRGPWRINREALMKLIEEQGRVVENGPRISPPIRPQR
jgi:excisionase family DNA binding protein